MRRSRLDNWICSLEGLSEVTPENLESLQLERLNSLLLRERERGGFYSALPCRLESLSELAALPFTTAEQLAENVSSMLLCSQAEVSRVISGSTSGTTGPAKRVFYTRRDIEHTVGFFAAGIGEFVSSGDTVMIAMPFSGPFGLGDLIAEAVASLGAAALRTGAGRSLGELCSELDSAQPAAYIGMPVPLLGLLMYYVNLNGHLPPLRRALISGDACPEGVVSEIEALLSSRLFPHYGSREMCLGGAVTCPAHDGMHLRANHIIAEIVDAAGSPLPAGEWGELVITTLDMEALPLIRYRTGDYTRLLPAPCPCGSCTPRLDRVSRLNRRERLMEQLDSALFLLPSLLDYAAELLPGRLKISALTLDGRDPGLAASAKRLFPDSEIEAVCRKADENTVLSARKRTFL